jgi:hypothetical protein
MQFTFIRRAAVVVALALLAGACGGGGGVGEGLQKGKGGQGGEGAIGQATTTTAPVVITTVPATTVKPTVTTIATPSAVFTINSDTKGQYIEPLNHSVRANQLVRFHNADTIAHVIDGKIGSTVVMGPSPSIAPGADWDVRPNVRGTYDIVDEQRPYAAGVQLTVTA